MIYYNNNWYSDIDGFLISHLKDKIKGSCLFIHFGSPSCKECFISEENLKEKIYNSTKKIVKFCKQNKLKLIYASSEGAGQFDNNELQLYYNYYKLKAENHIKSKLKDYIILRIPRVYDKESKKGLLSLEIVDNPLKEIEYYELDDFIRDTLDIIDGKISEYKNHKKDTLRDIVLKYF